MWWRSVGVAAPADRVWTLLTEVEHWPVWGPTVVASRLDGPGARIGPGRTGAVRTPVGLWLRFEVTAYDDVARTWSWRVLRVAASVFLIGDVPVGASIMASGHQPPDAGARWVVTRLLVG